jgi:hypothetical protein
VPALLLAAGFHDLRCTAVYETVSEPAAVARLGALYAQRIAEAWAEPFQRHGWATADDITGMIAAWREWPSKPGAFLASAWCQAVAWK